MGTALGIGTSQLGQPNTWGYFPSYASGVPAYPFTQQTQQYTQPLQYAPFGYGVASHPFGGQTAQLALLPQLSQLLHVLPQQLQQLQQLQQQQHAIQHQQLQLLQQLLQIVPQQIHQVQQLVHLLPQLLPQQTPFGAATPGFAGMGLSQPLSGPLGWSPSAQPLVAGQGFGVSFPTGQVM